MSEPHANTPLNHTNEIVLQDQNIYESEGSTPKEEVKVDNNDFS